MNLYLVDLDLFMSTEVRDKLSEILRQAQGDLSLRAFAKNLDVSYGALNSWLTGVSFPERESLEKIAKVLGRSLEDLLVELRGDRAANTPEKAEDLLPLANNLSDTEAFRLATLLLERVKSAIAKQLS